MSEYFKNSLLIILVLFVNIIYAQWHLNNGPRYENIRCITIKDSLLFAGTWYSGVFVSSDKGEHWVNKNTNLPSISSGYHLSISSIKSIDSVVFLGTFGNGIYASYDNADTWEYKSNGLPIFTQPFASQHPYITDFIQSGQNIIVTTKAGIYYSSDMGNYWQESNGLHSGANVIRITKKDSVLFTILPSNGIYKSSDDGLNWSFVSNPGGEKWLISAGSLSVFIQADSNKILRSDDDGLTWNLLNLGIASYPTTLIHSIKCIGTEIYVGTSAYGVLHSTDNGNTWTSLNYGLTRAGISDMIIDGNEIFAASSIGLFYSSDSGQTWSYSAEGFARIPQLKKIMAKGNKLYLNSTIGLVLSENKGQTWLPISACPFGLLGGDGQYDFVLFDNKLITTRSGLGIFISDNNGLQWQAINNGLPCPGASMVAISGSDIVIINDTCGVYISQDTGLTWTSIHNGLPAYSSPYYMHYLAASDSVIYVGLGHSKTIYETRDKGMSWAISYTPQTTIRKIVFSGTNVMQIAMGTSVRISNDYGLTWTENLTGFISNNSSYGFITGYIDGNDFYVGTHDNGVYKLMDTVWVPINSGFSLTGNHQVYDLIVHDSVIYAAKYMKGLWERNIEDVHINSFSGNIFRDFNNNGFKDTNDVNIENAIVTTKISGNFANTDTSGNYFIYTDNLQDTIIPFVNSLYASINPAYYAVTQSESNKDFAVYFLPNVKDLRITITGVTPARPGCNYVVRLTYKNVGSVVMDGKVNLLFDNAVSHLQSVPVSDSTWANQLSWDFQNLTPLESRNISAVFHIPYNTPLGSILSFTASVLPIIGDTVPSDNTETFEEIVTGSYDPNEKEVCSNIISPIDVLLSRPLIFTIYFQNTGTDTAFTVRIIDTLSPQLFIPSFEVLSASHEYSYKIKDQGAVEFLFENILLPDSNTNEPLSHGFIKYKITADKTLSVGDSITNCAYIYFDFNEPIKTNTTVTRVKETIEVNDNINDNDYILVYPNPSIGLFYLIVNESNRDGKEQNTTIYYVHIYDIFGKNIFNSQYYAHSNPVSIDLSMQPGGIFILIVKTDYATYFKKIIIQ